MGSFDFNCMASSLPIKRGTPVMAFLLVKQSGRWRENPVNSADEWELRTLPLEARYNEAASIEGLREDLIGDSWLRSLSRDLIELDQGENECHDKPVRRTDTLEALFEKMHSERVACYPAFVGERKSPAVLPAELPDGACRLALALIRKDVWRYFARSRWNHYHLGKCTADRFRQWAKEAFQRRVSLEAELRQCHRNENEEVSGQRLVQIMVEMDGHMPDNPVWEKLFPFCHQYGLRNARKDFIELARVVDKDHGMMESVVPWVERVGETIFVLQAMEAQRITLRPSNSVGGHDPADWEDVAKMHTYFAKLATKEREKLRREWGE